MIEPIFLNAVEVAGGYVHPVLPAEKLQPDVPAILAADLYEMAEQEVPLEQVMRELRYEVWVRMLSVPPDARGVVKVTVEWRPGERRPK